MGCIARGIASKTSKRPSTATTAAKTGSTPSPKREITNTFKASMRSASKSLLEASPIEHLQMLKVSLNEKWRTKRSELVFRRK